LTLSPTLLRRGFRCTPLTNGKPVVSSYIYIYIYIETNIDTRGWGRSGTSDRKLRGDFGTTPTIIADLHFYLQSLVPYTKEGSIPLFLMGHSMGGQISSYYLLNPQSPYYQKPTPKSSSPTSQFKLAGVILIAPYIALHPATQPSRLLEISGRIAQMLLPKMTIKQKVEPKYVSRNPAILEDIEKDNGHLHHKYGTLEGLGGMLDRAAWLNGLHTKKQRDYDGADVLTGNVPPVWIGHGTEDRATWFVASKRLFESLDYVDDKTFKEYEGAYHKLMNEPDGIGEEMTKDVTQWIEAHISKTDEA
jgi:acylglycerol lipase